MINKRISTKNNKAVQVKSEGKKQTLDDKLDRKESKETKRKFIPKRYSRSREIELTKTAAREFTKNYRRRQNTLQRACQKNS